MDSSIELKNYGMSGYYILDISTGSTTFSKASRYKEFPGFTGLYFKDDDTFFGFYPSTTGLKIYYEGKEYSLTPELNISLAKDGKNRTFRIEEYGIEIHYIESPYIGFDCWSNEIDVDLFFYIEQSYKDESFYEGGTLESEEA